MADTRAASRGRLDTPRDLRRTLVKRPTFRADAFGSFAEAFARYMGTARFIAWMTMVVVVWIGWNTLTPTQWRFDEFPFIFLTLALSLQASYAAPLILLAQNRQEDRDRAIAEQDRRVASQSKADMEFLARETASLRMALGEVATRDYLRSELRLLLEELEERDRQRDLVDQPSGDSGDSPRTT
ncbi:putative membrane protein [Nocardioides luteus]|uniref:Membrane protein n=1 Tax=Nocardioides luteus TaxID=1844 RepID=A0ABQ5SWF7_9ACTN|nr:DUF1003 domain-containing protein [Nocardioides luteus]MDR7311938.1 putative membrane protein [Nocardioides luteus]GGR68528.1 membrane protein [Nocardioides luteus]GLJ68181.1 membrane protein [Nocardioides luteus]